VGKGKYKEERNSVQHSTLPPLTLTEFKTGRKSGNASNRKCSGVILRAYISTENELLNSHERMQAVYTCNGYSFAEVLTKHFRQFCQSTQVGFALVTGITVISQFRWSSYQCYLLPKRIQSVPPSVLLYSKETSETVS
jgi:hypothetical protein